MLRRFAAHFAVVAVLTLSAGAVSHAQNFWQRCWGPYPVRVKALAATQTGAVIAGTDGVMGSGMGILRSWDGGITWGGVNNGLLNLDVVSLFVTRKGAIFAGTSIWWGEEGRCLYRSTNTADSWSPADSGLADQRAVGALGEDNTGWLFCGPSNGLRDVFRSTDDGATWNPTSSPQGDWCQALLGTPDGLLLSASFNSVYRSSDGGATWIRADSGLNQALPLISSLAVKPDGMLFAGMAYGGGVYRSTNSGDLWTRTSLDTAYVTSLALTASGTLIVGTFEKGVFWSSDDGDSWQQDTSGLPPFSVWSLVVSGDGYVFAGTDSGGIFRSREPFPTGIEGGPMLPPPSFLLSQNYPNPFNPSTTIEYMLPSRLSVTLSVFNTLGQEVARLVDGDRDAGHHELVLDASGLSSGVYFYRLAAGSLVVTKKLLKVN